MSQVLFGLRRGLERRTGPMRQTVDRGGALLEREVRGILDRRRQSLAAVGGRLDALSPLATLGRGYSVARTEDGAVLRAVGDFTVGDRFLLRVSDGELSCETLDLKEGT